MHGSFDLGKQHEDYVSSLVRSGRFDSRNDVLREGVRLVEEHEKRRAALDAAVARGVADAEAGHVHDLAEVCDDLKARYLRMAEARDQV